MPRKSYYQANKEKCKAAARAWHLANPEKVNDIKRDYRDRKAEQEGRITPGKHRRRRRRLTRPPNLPEPIFGGGLTPAAEELVRGLITKPYIRRDVLELNFPISDDERAMRLDERGNLIPYIEGDEEDDAGRRSLMDQDAERQRLYYEEHREAEIERSKFSHRKRRDIENKRRREGITDALYYRKKVRGMRRMRRVRVITHYGNGKMACVLCKEAIGKLLTIDYMDTSRDRRTRYSGDELYRRLEKDGYPDGYRTICKKCQRNIRKLNTLKMKIERASVLSGIDPNTLDSF